MNYNTCQHWKHRHPASFGKQPPDKGPEEEEKTDNGEMYINNAKQRKTGGRKSVDVEITLTINFPGLRKPERIIEAIANV